MERSVTYDDILDHGYWHHRIPLDGDRFTPGFAGPEQWAALGLPEDLEGKSFLDVGTFDGLLAFEAERRGAEEVVAVDLWDGPAASEYYSGVHTDPPGFRLVQAYLGSGVCGRELGVTELSAGDLGTFDVVACANVLSLVKCPLVAIENLLDVARDRVVIGTRVTQSVSGADAAEFVYAAGSDPPVEWWVPTLGCLESMVATLGCERIAGFHPGYPDPVLPPYREGQVTCAGTRLFRTRERDEVLGRLECGDDVVVTYDETPSCRVATTLDGRAVQGWFPADAVDTDSGTATVSRIAQLLRRARAVRREAGTPTLARKTLRFLWSNSPLSGDTDVARNMGVVHGWVECR